MEGRGNYLQRMGQYRYHVFVCTSGKHCPKQGAAEVHEALKDGVKEAGLKGIVRVNHAGCMNQCGHGPMVVVYPEDTWYAHVDERGARQIIQEHLVRGHPVERYRYHAPPGDNKRV
jgi:(2Fe-2S) ferredoxin